MLTGLISIIEEYLEGMGRGDPSTSQGKARVSSSHQHHAQSERKKSTTTETQSNTQIDTPLAPQWKEEDAGLYYLHRAMRTHLKDFKGTRRDPKTKGRAQHEVDSNIGLLDACPMDVREALTRDAFFSQKRCPEVFDYMKRENKEFHSYVDMAIKLMKTKVKLPEPPKSKSKSSQPPEKKDKNIDPGVLFRNFFGIYDKYVEEYMTRLNSVGSSTSKRP